MTKGEQHGHGGQPGEPFRTGPVAGQSRARTRAFPVPLVLAALLVGAVGARVALAPSRSDAVGALAATVETWTISAEGERLDVLALTSTAVRSQVGSGGRCCPSLLLQLMRPIVRISPGPAQPLLLESDDACVDSQTARFAVQTEPR